MADLKKRNKVLIVDDEERLLRVLRLGLKDRGFDVHTVKSGEDAIKRLWEESYDVMLTDIRMSAMSGVELVYELERMRIRMPVIVMTAYADVESAVKTLKHGAYDYIRKPFTIDELERVIRDVLARVVETSGESLPGLTEGVEEKEKELIIKALYKTGNVKAKAAVVLNISERTLWYKIKKYGLE